jgi:hypothetical protein
LPADFVSTVNAAGRTSSTEALASGPYLTALVDRFTLKWFVRDLDIRSTLSANTIQEPLQELVRGGSRR